MKTAALIQFIQVLHKSWLSQDPADFVALLNFHRKFFKILVVAHVSIYIFSYDVATFLAEFSNPSLVEFVDALGLICFLKREAADLLVFISRST